MIERVGAIERSRLRARPQFTMFMNLLNTALYDFIIDCIYPSIYSSIYSSIDTAHTEHWSTQVICKMNRIHPSLNQWTFLLAHLYLSINMLIIHLNLSYTYKAIFIICLSINRKIVHVRCFNQKKNSNNDEFHFVVTSHQNQRVVNVGINQLRKQCFVSLSVSVCPISYTWNVIFIYRQLGWDLLHFDAIFNAQAVIWL